MSFVSSSFARRSSLTVESYPIAIPLPSSTIYPSCVIYARRLSMSVFDFISFSRDASTSLSAFSKSDRRTFIVSLSSYDIFKVRWIRIVDSAMLLFNSFAFFTSFYSFS
jgi:hypothetical protein